MFFKPLYEDLYIIVRRSMFLKAVFLDGDLSFAKNDMEEFCDSNGEFRGKEEEVYDAIVSMLDF